MISFRFIVIVAMLFTIPVAYAEEIRKDTVDENTKLLFIDTAISTTHAHDRQQLSLLPPEIVTYKSYPFSDHVLFKKEFPWLYEFIFREKGLPKSVVINKWVQPVTISLGFPNRLRPVESAMIDGKPITEFEEWPHFFFTDIRLPGGGIPVNYYLTEGGTEPVEKRLAEEIEKIIEKSLLQLEKASGLEMNYTMPKKDKKDNPAKVRIIILNQKDISYWKTPYKQAFTGRSMSTMTPPRPIYFRSIENRMYPVRFTPYSDYQVDGYFLTNEKNEIEFAFCFIWDGHEYSMMKALVKECLLRAMGLPDLLAVAGTQRGNFVDYLGPWNAEDDKRWLPEQKKEFLDKEDGYTGLDLQLLELLYNDAIKPGMDPIEAFKALP